MTKVTDLHQRWLNDPDYQAAYEQLAAEFELASTIIAARTQAGLTQAELAQRMNSKQSLVARLESGAQNTTVKTLTRIATATGTELKISFVQSMDPSASQEPAS